MADAPYRAAAPDPLGTALARYPRSTTTRRDQQVRGVSAIALGAGAAVALGLGSALIAAPLTIVAGLAAVGVGIVKRRPASHVDVHEHGLRQHGATPVAVRWSEVASVTATFTPDQAASHHDGQRLILDVAGARVELAGGLALVGLLLAQLEDATRAHRRRRLTERLADGATVALASCALHADRLRLDDGSQWSTAEIRLAHRRRGFLYVQGPDAAIQIPIDTVPDADLVIERLSAHVPTS